MEQWLRGYFPVCVGRGSKAWSKRHAAYTPAAATEQHGAAGQLSDIRRISITLGMFPLHFPLASHVQRVAQTTAHTSATRAASQMITSYSDAKPKTTSWQGETRPLRSDCMLSSTSMYTHAALIVPHASADNNPWERRSSWSCSAPVEIVNALQAHRNTFH
jgi:hypothetical protein